MSSRDEGDQKSEKLSKRYGNNVLEKENVTVD